MPIVLGMRDSNTYLGSPLIPIGDVAKRFGVTVATVRAWERADKIRSVRTPGGQRRFRVEDIEALERAS